MSQQPFMQLYVADYLGDTRHLSTEQHGAYLLLLMTMWRHGGSLPNDPAKLARIAGVSTKRWHLVAPDVMQFFTIEGDFITQKRLQQERQKAVSKSEKRKTSGKLGGEAKALKDKAPAVANATVLPQHSSEPESERKKKEPLRGRAEAPLDLSEASVFRFGKAVLGKGAGGVIVKLKARCRNDMKALATLLETASEKENPMEWVQATLKSPDPEADIYRLVDWEGKPKAEPKAHVPRPTGWWRNDPEYRGVL